MYKMCVSDQTLVISHKSNIYITESAFSLRIKCTEMFGLIVLSVTLILIIVLKIKSISASDSTFFLPPCLQA